MMNLALWIIALAAFLLVLLLTRRHYKKQLRKKNVHINELLKSLTNLQEKLKDKERRRDFRLNLIEQECYFEFVDFGDQTLQELNHRKGRGFVKDISRAGMQLKCQFDLPVKKEITLLLHFSLQGENFSLKGKIVRKEERLELLTYGINFIEMDTAEEQKLIRALQKLEIERRKTI